MAVKKYVRGMMTLEAIDAFFELVKWRDTPEEQRDYEDEEERGYIIPECLKIIQTLVEDEQDPNAPPQAAPAQPAAAPAAPSAPAPAAPAQSEAPAQGGGKPPEEMQKDGYDAGWHQAHRGGDGQPKGPHKDDPAYKTGFEAGFKQGQHAQTVRAGLGSQDPKQAHAANQAAAALLGPHFDNIAQGLSRMAAKRGLQSPGSIKTKSGDVAQPHAIAHEPLSDWASRTVRGGSHTTLARDINNFYHRVQSHEGDTTEGKLRPHEIANHLRTSALNYLPHFARTSRGPTSGTGVRHGDPDAGASQGGEAPGRVARAAGRAGRVMSGAPKDPEGKSPIDTAPAREPEGMEPTEKQHVHGVVHDIINTHPDLESSPQELAAGRDRRKLAHAYYKALSGEGDAQDWGSHAAAIGLDMSDKKAAQAHRQWAKEVITGVKSGGTKGGEMVPAPKPGFHEIMRFDPRMKDYMKRAGGSSKTESFNAFVARLYGISLNESQGWFTDDAAHALFGRWLSTLLRKSS